jgi:hypothetical protein
MCLYHIYDNPYGRHVDLGFTHFSGGEGIPQFQNLAIILQN